MRIIDTGASWVINPEVIFLSMIFRSALLSDPEENSVSPSRMVKPDPLSRNTAGLLSASMMRNDSESLLGSS
jgi:hypothetical protein